MISECGYVIIVRFNCALMKLTRFSLFLLSFALIGLGISLLSNIDKSEAAFGTSPPWVRNDHLRPGMTYETIINLSRNEQDTAMQVNTRIGGDDEVQRWLKIEDEDDLIMKKGQKVLPMKVTVKVPRRATLKDYKGGIFVTLQPVQEEGDQKGGTVAIQLGAHIVVELSVVGEEVVNYRVKSLTVDSLEEEDYFHINVDVENKGNVELKKLNGQVDIYNKDETEVLHSLAFGELGDPVPPDTLLKTQIVFSEVTLEPGEYWVKSRVFKDDEVIYENRLYQKVNEAEVPVVTPEDVEDVKKPSLPTLPEEEQTVLSPDEAEAMKTAAPPAAQTQDNTWFLVFGLAGLGFGLLSLTAIIVVLVVMMKRQQQTTLQQYLSQQAPHPAAPPESGDSEKTSKSKSS